LMTGPVSNQRAKETRQKVLAISVVLLLHNMPDFSAGAQNCVAGKHTYAFSFASLSVNGMKIILQRGLCANEVNRLHLKVFMSFVIA